MQNLGPRQLKFLMNIYGPFLGAGVKVRAIRSDWKEIQVSMKLRWYNRNALGTHFGGSLYSMVDPHLVLMLMKLLGPNYVIWDKFAEIDFVRPGKGEVSCKISLMDQEIESIRGAADRGETVYPKFELQVLDDEGHLIARIKKTLYVRMREERETIQ